MLTLLFALAYIQFTLEASMIGFTIERANTYLSVSPAIKSNHAPSRSAHLSALWFAVGVHRAHFQYHGATAGHQAVRSVVSAAVDLDNFCFLTPVFVLSAASRIILLFLGPEYLEVFAQVRNWPKQPCF
jgi:hypothetical protein